ncbi:neuronatin isoform X3 [Octodon degus]|uniref:Neuronatin n=1 Tax=Octodon degus TaxID=10160 RepID=A0A6P3VAM9_OCTDE|nr:neuronatin isoform X3 [Octodon degus]
MRCAPGHPSSGNTTPTAHAQLGSRQILKARQSRLQQCAQQRTPRDHWISARTLAREHPPTTLGTMAAVAAASAELLIIGWYIFRVLLQVFLECCIYWVGFAFRNPSGTQPIARSVQILPAEVGVHGVPDRAAGAGGAQAASPQLRLQLPALGGPIARCSCASQPAWEQVPRRNGGSPVFPRQRSTCQGQ